MDYLSKIPDDLIGSTLYTNTTTTLFCPSFVNRLFIISNCLLFRGFGGKNKNRKSHNKMNSTIETFYSKKKTEEKVCSTAQGGEKDKNHQGVTYPFN